MLQLVILPYKMPPHQRLYSQSGTAIRSYKEFSILLMDTLTCTLQWLGIKLLKVDLLTHAVFKNQTKPCHRRIQEVSGQDGIRS